MNAPKWWIAERQHILADWDGHHITFTLFWPFLTITGRCSTRCSAVPPSHAALARKQEIDVRILCALHTCRRQQNQHPHTHVFVTALHADKSP